VIVEGVAVRFQLLPDVIDLSLILTLSGLFAVMTASIGVAARFDSDRLGRFVLFGMLGAAVGTIISILGALS
jgi:FtsH-binding integral membrane protein